MSKGAAKLSGFNATKDAQDLHKAMKGLGTDDSVLIKIFTGRPRKHLQLIKKEFAHLDKKSLENWVEGETSGNYETVLLNLLEPRAELKVKYLHKATAGVGTNEDVLIQTLAPASNAELKKLNELYQKKHKSDLASLLKSEISGDFAKLMLEIVRGTRPDDGPVDDDKAKADAHLLYKEGEGKLGTNEAVFIDIITHRSKAHLQQVRRHYEQKTGHTLEKAIEKETSGDFRKALLAFLQTPAEYHAQLFDEAMKGTGTNDAQLVRLVTTLTKSQLKEANLVYTKKHQKTLAAAIKSETSGNYEKALLGLLPPVA